MAKKQYAFYPGCSSQKGASASNFCTSMSVDVRQARHPAERNSRLELLRRLDRLRRRRRTAASGHQRPQPGIGGKEAAGQDMVSGCPACWLATRETAERLQWRRAA